MTNYRAEILAVANIWRELVEIKQMEGLPNKFGIPESIVVVGSGCSLPVATLAAHAFLVAGARFAIALTPFQVVASGLRTKCACIVSAGGNHHDAVACLEHFRRYGVPTMLLTLNADSPLALLIGDYDDGIVVCADSSRAAIPSGFIPVLHPLSLALLIPQIVQTDDLDSQTKRQLFDLAIEDDDRDAQRVHGALPQHVTVVCTPWAEAAALDYETRIMESGLTPPTLCDPWNFCHGRYMPIALGRSVLAFFCTKGERNVLKPIHCQVPSHSVMLDVVSPANGYWGGIYCLMRSILWTARVALAEGIDPAMPSIPGWGDALYNAGISI